jgi:hypothetical protein
MNAGVDHEPATMVLAETAEQAWFGVLAPFQAGGYPTSKMPWQSSSAER